MYVLRYFVSSLFLLSVFRDFVLSFVSSVVVSFVVSFFCSFLWYGYLFRYGVGLHLCMYVVWFFS